MEERTGTKYTPYLYNAKELDEETGLYYYHARYYDPRISMFYGVDPHAENYLPVSPYAYVANNPILFIDPDGRDIYIYYDDQRYKYKNGNIYQNVDGRWQQYRTEEGSYIATIQNSLNALASQQDGNSLISFFSGDEHHIQIRQRQEGGTGEGNQLIGWSIVTDKNPEGAIIPTENDLLQNPLFVSIGHEMAHRKDIAKGTFDDSEWFSLNGKSIPTAEKYATHYENKIRAEHGLPLRTHYARNNRRGVGPEIINKRGQSNFFKQYNRPFDYRYRVGRRAFYRKL